MDSFASFGNSATTTEAPQTLPQYVGYIACVLAAILFGSNFIPVKKFETGDGLFFQLVLCMAIWLPSVVLHAIQGFPRFWPLAMLGGFLWCTGNIMVVPIIQCIGMAMGLLIWGVSNMLTGWATGRFGAFGMDPEPLGNPTLNYFGVALCFISALIVFLIKPHIENVDQTAERTYSEKDAGFINERDPLIPPFSGNSVGIATLRLFLSQLFSFI
ncbi:TMEM144 [Bugula neritina]|uniref:TMEM144 n=1 Tax=Bugula neritina TaxID=10212 RepID=A0A7J7KEX7_BUGNE|nr:TMEM144 [Bugula neritina]